MVKHAASHVGKSAWRAWRGVMMGAVMVRYPVSWAGTAYGRGVRREVKHLSTCRKGYSVSSGERKRIRPNRLRVIPVGGCVAGVVGSRVPVPTGRAGVIKRLARGTGLKAWPQRVPAPYLEACRLPIMCPK